MKNNIIQFRHPRQKYTNLAGAEKWLRPQALLVSVKPQLVVVKEGSTLPYSLILEVE